MERVYTIQKTSKRLKAGQMYAWALLTIGLAVVFFSVPEQVGSTTPMQRGLNVGGSVATLFGFGWLMVNRWQRWWHHG